MFPLVLFVALAVLVGRAHAQATTAVSTVGSTVRVAKGQLYRVVLSFVKMPNREVTSLIVAIENMKTLRLIRAESRIAGNRTLLELTYEARGNDSLTIGDTATIDGKLATVHSVQPLSSPPALGT